MRTDFSVDFEAVDVPCPGTLLLSHVVDHYYVVCPLPSPDVGPFVLVCDGTLLPTTIKTAASLVSFKVKDRVAYLFGKFSMIKQVKKI